MTITKQSIKMEVTSAIARDSGLADAIRVAVGFNPVWSKMDLLEYLLVWLALKSLTPQNSANCHWRYSEYFQVIASLKEGV